MTGKFRDAKRNFARLVERVNERFETGFVPFVESGANVREVFETIDGIYGRKYGETR